MDSSIPEVLSARLDKLTRDSTTGATPLAQRAAILVLQAVDPQLEVSDSDLPLLLTDLIHAIMRTQPTMAPMLNLGNRLLQAVSHSEPGTELRGKIRGLAGAIVNQLETSSCSSNVRGRARE